jgi:hypothetical protein
MTDRLLIIYGACDASATLPGGEAFIKLGAKLTSLNLLTGEAKFPDSEHVILPLTELTCFFLSHLWLSGLSFTRQKFRLIYIVNHCPTKFMLAINSFGDMNL